MRNTREAGYRRVIESVSSRLDPFMALYKPYVDGVENLPADGRFLLVGNHTQAGTEVLLIPQVVRRTIGTRVRPLADRRFGNIRGPMADVMAAYGAVIGTPDAARELMAADQTILVFPGGGREINKGSDQLYSLMWNGRNGFARVSIENDYPIVPVALVGGDDLYHVLTSSDGRWARMTKPLATRMTGDSNMAMHLMRGVGPTMIPRPQRMYLRFGTPVDTTRPKRANAEKWTATVRDRVKTELEANLSELLQIRSTDPYRQLAPWAWTSAAAPQ